MEYTIRYSADGGDKEKSFGLSGAAISLYVLDGEHYLRHLTLDPSDGEDMFGLTPDFPVVSGSHISAKTVWNSLISQFNLLQSMAIGNLMCRRMISDELDDVRFQEKKELREHLYEIGKDQCALEEDELARLFDKDYVYLHRIFSHPGVRNVARLLAQTIEKERTLERDRAMLILEMLRQL